MQRNYIIVSAAILCGLLAIDIALRILPAVRGSCESTKASDYRIIEDRSGFIRIIDGDREIFAFEALSGLPPPVPFEPPPAD